MINSMVAAFSLYSRIPVPRRELTAENTRFVFVFFPLVGAVIGGIVAAFMLFCEYFGFRGIFFAAGAVMLNILITGGIHWDGFCDVTDAVSARKGREETLRIMKDPRAGAFAVIYMAAMLAVQVGAYTQVFSGGRDMGDGGDIADGYIGAVAGIFVFSRVLTGLSVVMFPRAKSDGLASMLAQGSEKKGVAAVQAVIAAGILAAGVWRYGVLTGGILAAVSAGIFVWYYGYSKARFGGITGDVAGFFLSVFETVMVLVIAVCGVVL